MKEPLISVIVPVYNVEKYLPMCLNSILAQTYKNFEVICVDDGSTDGSLALLQKYAQKDARIKVTHQENRGLSGARNTGVDAAVGQYFCFVDSDDRIHPQLLEICLYLAQKEQADWVVFQLREIAENATPEIKQYDVEKIPYLLTQNPLQYCAPKQKFEVPFSVWSKFYTAKFYMKHRFYLKINFEDYPQTLDFCAAHPQTVCLGEALYFYTKNQDSISRSNFSVQKIKDYQAGLNYVYDIYKDRPQELMLVVENVFGRIFKRQLSLINKSDKDHKQNLMRAFADELNDLYNKRCVRLRGNKFKNWLKYRWLIIKAKREKK